MNSESVLSNSMAKMVTTTTPPPPPLLCTCFRVNLAAPHTHVMLFGVVRLGGSQAAALGFFGGHTSANMHDYQVSHDGSSNPHILLGQSFS